MTPACEDTNSKLVDVVTVTNVDDEYRVGNSLLQIWERRLGHKAKGVPTLRKRFGQDFDVEVQATF